MVKSKFKIPISTQYPKVTWLYMIRPPIIADVTWSRDTLLPEGLFKLDDQALHDLLALAEVAFGHQAAHLGK